MRSIPLSTRLLPLGLIAGAFALAAAVLGCGEKIQAPEAVGIPTSSLYLEQQPWDLTDPTDVLQADGRVFVVESDPGTLTKYTTSQEILYQAEGLLSPVAITLEKTSRRILVGENPEGGWPRISIFDQGELQPLGTVDLTDKVKSLSGLCADDQYVYISDPDSHAVHRFRWVGAAEGLLAAQGLVCNNLGSRESPQFVFDPRGMALDGEGMLLICDADTVRNWVLRFDPLPAAADSLGTGTAVVFREIACPSPPVEAFVLGSAPGCGETFEPGPSSEPGGLYAPFGVGVDTEGQIYVADRLNLRGQRYTPDGMFDLAFGDGAGGVEPLRDPLRLSTWLGSTSQSGIPIIIPGARIYVVDPVHAQIRIFEDKRWSDFQNNP